MAVTTVAELLAVLEKSKLLAPDQLTRARSLVGEITDPATVARALARENLITRWQGGQLLAGRSSFYLGKYRLIELLGRGGMGGVFLGEHVTMNRRVALKIVSRQIGKDPAALDRFLAEARVIAALDHPNIVQVYNVDNEGDRYYIVMEYVDGMDLQRWVEAHGPLDCQRAVDCIRQAADGLEHAHQRGVIHCDIKPSNLLVNPQGVVKILDMGLAKLADSDRPTNEAQEQRVLGSVDYLAPEQALNSPALDCRADIYALGCTFYFLLTGHPPFPNGTLPERILRHQTQQPTSICSEQPEVPAELDSFCSKMMAKQPADRYQTAAEVSRWLGEWRPPTPTLRRAVPLQHAGELDESQEEEPFGAGLGRGDGRRLSPLDDLGRDLDGSPLDILSAAGDVALGLNADFAALVPSSAGSRDSATTSKANAGGWVARLRAGSKPILILGAVAAAAVIVTVATVILSRARQVVTLAQQSPGPIAQQPATDNKATPSEPSLPTGTPSGPAQATIGPPKPPAPNLAATGEPPTAETAKGKRRSSGLSKPTLANPPDGASAPGALQTEPPQPEQPPETKKKRRKKDPTESGFGPPKADSPTPAEPLKQSAQNAVVEPPKKTGPFQDLADAVDLPTSINDSQSPEMPVVPVSLGKLQLPLVSPLQVSLKGGQEAFRQEAFQSDRSYVLLPELDDAAGRSWLIRVVPYAQDIARISLDQDTLNMYWLPPITQAVVNPLRNCSLLVSLGDASQTVGLYRAQEVPALPIDLQDGVSKCVLPCDLIYEATTRLQVTGLGGKLPRFELRPGDPIASKDKIEITLQDVKLPAVTLRIGFDVKEQTATVDSAMFYQLSGQDKPKALRLKAADDVAMNLQRKINAWNRPMTPRQWQAIEKEFKEAQAQFVQMSALSELCKAVNRVGKVHFRVFNQVGDRQIDLFVTPPPDRRAGDSDSDSDAKAAPTVNPEPEKKKRGP